jgi:Cyclin, N-terminal domain/Cyclin, C-terminal domain
LSTSEGRSALCNRKEYQLAAMTALYVAIKLHEPLEMETSLLADLSRGCYNEMEFVEMEQVILLSLKWRVNGPTALGFVQHYLTFLPDSVHPCVSEAIFDYARYQIELATADQSFVNIRPSEVGLAALLNALEGIDTKLLSFKIQSKFIRNIERFSEMVVEDVESLQAKLSLMLINMLSLELSEFVDVAIEQEALAEREFLDGDDDYKPSIISRRNSPVSVIRGR